ncbi:MAG: hypothetical protein ACP5QP_06925 [Brevinematia bacterium]
MRKFVMLIFVIVLLLTLNYSYARDLKVYLCPSTMVFNDGVLVGGILGIDLVVGYSKFSSSDFISLSSELNFFNSQKENYNFSYFSIKFIPTYDLLIYSFEKNKNIYFKGGLGVGLSLSSVKLQNIEYSGIMILFEPSIGVIYNFYQNMWFGINFRYNISSELGGKVSPILSPVIVIPFAIEF